MNNQQDPFGPLIEGHEADGIKEVTFTWDGEEFTVPAFDELTADQMTALANDVEEAALVIQADIDENAENVAKLKQLQAILKSLA